MQRLVAPLYRHLKLSLGQPVNSPRAPAAALRLKRQRFFERLLAVGQDSTRRCTAATADKSAQYASAGICHDWSWHLVVFQHLAANRPVGKSSLARVGSQPYCPLGNAWSRGVPGRQVAAKMPQMPEIPLRI